MKPEYIDYADFCKRNYKVGQPIKQKKEIFVFLGVNENGWPEWFRIPKNQKEFDYLHNDSQTQEGKKFA